MKTRSGKSAYGHLGLRSGRCTSAPTKVKRKTLAKKIRPATTQAATPQAAQEVAAQEVAVIEASVVTVIPFVPISNSGLLISVDEAVWTFAGETPIGANAVVRVFHGQRWRSPPYDRNVGAIVKFSFDKCVCVAHVTNLRMKMALLLKAFKIAASNPFVDVEKYNDMAKGSLKVDRDAEISRYVVDGATDFKTATFLRLV